MRIVEYRVWAKFEDEEEYMDYDVESINNPFEEHRKGNIILLQYTGLKDSKGKKIFEGDIINFYHSQGKDRSSYNVVVEWKQEWCGFYFDDNKRLNSSMRIEVIGNKYENPQLLTLNA